jgi:hypothetical protein
MPRRTREEQQAYEAALYQVAGKGEQNKSSSFQMGPRYWRPLDDTTVLALYPMHSSHSDSTLLEQADFERLAGWLHRSRMGDVWTNAGGQNTMQAKRLPDAGVHFTTFWNSTPHQVAGSFRMATSQVLDLMAWMDDKLANGWTGWKSGRRREQLKEVPPHLADWALNVIIDRDTGYLADGDDTLYFKGPEDMSYEEWRDYVNEMAGVLHVVEFCATPLSQGRWWKTGTKSTFRTTAKGYR